MPNPRHCNTNTAGLSTFYNLKYKYVSIVFIVIEELLKRALPSRLIIIVIVIIIIIILLAMFIVLSS